MILTGKCDKTRYEIDTNGKSIKSVSYKETAVRRVLVKDRILVMPNSVLLKLDSPPDLVPDTEIAAFWYTRTGYEFIKKPVWYFFEPTSKLIVFPPPLSDGDSVIIDFDEEPSQS